MAFRDDFGDDSSSQATVINEQDYQANEDEIRVIQDLITKRIQHYHDSHNENLLLELPDNYNISANCYTNQNPAMRSLSIFVRAPEFTHLSPFCMNALFF